MEGELDELEERNAKVLEVNAKLDEEVKSLTKKLLEAHT